MNLKLTSIWNSPTLMTWLSYFTRASSLFVILPMILTKFTDAEISLWYLFSAVITLSSLADFGFRATFTRIISFAFGGAKHIGVHKGQASEKGKVNWSLIERIYSSMKRIYKWLSLAILLFMVSFGTWSMIRPISLVSPENLPWLAWSIIVFTTVIKFYGTIYQNYLEGLNKIALVRKAESVVSTGLIISSVIVLYFGGKLLELVIIFQLFGLFNIVVNIFLARKIENRKILKFKKIAFEKKFFDQIWQPAWRSGISGLMSIGLTNLTGILYAQIGSVQLVAAYLLALKIINQIKEVSMAPFYSKIPLMSRLRVQGKMKELISISQKGMMLSHLVFVLSVLFVSLFSKPLLEFINSNVSFVENEFWILLSFAFLIHRYGAMHMQLYLTTNHIKSHIADGISGVIFIVVTVFLIKEIDIYAFPIGMIAGYLGFYAIYSAKLSLSNLSLNFFKFETKSALIPFLCFITYAIIFLLA